MKTPLSLYSIDWLQLFCTCNLSESGDAPAIPTNLISKMADRNGYHRTYTLVEPLEYVKGYKWHRSVMWKNWCVAHISAIPSSSNHNPAGCSIKLHNPVLYIYDWYFILLDVLSALDWKPQNITRCDVCCDQHYFLNGLHPSTFIRNYACRKRSYLRVGRKANDFALYGHKDMYGVDYNSIRWGSRQSGVSVYLYNKTKELAEKKDKPWIQRAWAGAGFHAHKDVWRVEISITSEGCGLKNLTNKVLHTLFIDDLLDSSAVQNIFKVYAAKYFHFVKIDPKIKKKCDLPDVELLNLDTGSVYRPSSMRELADSGRMEKIVANKLTTMLNYLYKTNSIFENKDAAIKSVQETERIFSELYCVKRMASKVERTSEDALTASCMESLNIDSQRERLRCSLTVRDEIEWYDYQCRQAVRNLQGSYSPSPRRKSEQSKP